MAEKTDIVARRNYGTDLNTVLSRCPVPIVYDNEHFPNLTPNQVVVLNFLEYEPVEAGAKKISKAELAAAMGWPGQQVNNVERSQGVVEARKQLYVGKGAEINRHIPDVIKARVEHAKKENRGSNQASRIVLETAGVLGQQAKGPRIRIQADEINISFTETVNVMELANKQRVNSDELSE
jgi:hypothetical protein